MLGQELVHREHGHLVLAEDLLKRSIEENFAFVLRVLEILRLDVGPDLGDDLLSTMRLSYN